MDSKAVPRRVLLVAVCAVCALTSAFAQDRGVQLQTPLASGRRVALVIGNGAYTSSPLANAVNDAKAVAATLGALKFNVVKLALDTTAVALDRAIDQFVQLLQPGDVAVVYYAGHGIQIAGENYLLPIDFHAQDEADARYASYSAALLHDKLAERGARMKILILDACRNNPFRMSRSLGGGLAPMATVGRGSYIAFAAGPNSTADDNPRGKNGLFTTYLLEALNEPGLTLEQVFSRVRLKVDEASNGRQTPWTNSSVIGDFYFHPVPPPPAPSVVRTIAPAVLAYLSAPGVMKAAGRSVPDSSAPAAVQAASSDLMSAVKGAAPRLGISAVFATDGAGIVWADTTLDITNDIAQAMKGATPPPRNVRPFVRAAYVDLQAIANTSKLGMSFHEQVRAAPGATQQTLQNQLQQKFQDALVLVLGRVAKAAGANVVFAAADSGLAWMDESLDLTSATVKALDAATSGSKAADVSSAAAASVQDARIGYVNVQQMAARSKLGEASTAQVQQFQKDKQDPIARMPAGAEKDKATQSAQQEIDALNQRLQDQFKSALAPLIAKRARAAGLKLVFSADGGLAWIDPALDLTEALTKDLDAATAAKR